MWSNHFTKNKSNILILTFIVLSIFSACKKKNDPIPEPAKPCENDIDISIRGNQISSLKMYYNDKAKLTKIGTESSDYDYQYEADKIKVSASGIPYYEISLTNGKATKIMESGKANYQDLSYNADGYLVKVKTYIDNSLQSTHDLSYTNGNLSGFTTTSDDPSFKRNGTFEYGTDPSSSRLMYIHPIFSDIINSIYLPIEYLGKQSKNALNNYIYTYIKEANKSVYTTNFTYTKGDGKIVTVKSTEMGNSYKNDQLLPGTSSEITYDYRFSFGCDN